jgi:hypothetical protein
MTTPRIIDRPIKRQDRSEVEIASVPSQASPLDVEGIDLGLSAEEIVSAVREIRERGERLVTEAGPSGPTGRENGAQGLKFLSGALFLAPAFYARAGMGVAAELSRYPLNNPTGPVGLMLVSRDRRHATGESAFTYSSLGFSTVQSRGATFLKSPSKLSRCPPQSSVVAAIQISLIGIGVPARRKSANSRP